MIFLKPGWRRCAHAKRWILCGLMFLMCAGADALFGQGSSILTGTVLDPSAPRFRRRPSPRPDPRVW